MYFENQKQYFLAGKFFLKSKQYAKVSRQLEGHVFVQINSFLPNNLCSISVRIKDNKVQYVLIKGHAFPQGLNKNFSNAKRTVFMETKLLLLFFFSLLFNLCSMGAVLLSIMLFHVWLNFYCFCEPLFMGRTLCGDNPSHLHSFPDMSVRPSLIQRFSVWISTRLPLSLSFMSPMVDITNSVVSQNYQKTKRVMERNIVCSLPPC